MKRFPRSLIGCTAAAVFLFTASTYAADRAPPPPSAEVVSELQVRTLHLEQLVEQLTGQVEELRFHNQQLTKQVERLQDDLSLRVSRLEQGGTGAPPPDQMEAPPAAAPSTPPAPAPRASAAPSNELPYDPNAPMSSPVARQPDMSMPAPAAPSNTTTLPSNALVTPTQSGDGGFTLRTDASGKALPADPNAPRAPVAQAPATPAPIPRAAPNPAAVTAGGLTASQATVTMPQGTPKQQYDFSFDLLKKQDYARAEAAFRAFLKANPKDPLAGNAQYWLGESLYVRGDYQAAAMEFMNGYQQYPKSPKGPDNLLKLGMSMSHLNQAQGACTALGRIAKEYPDAPDEIRKTAQAERSKLKCT
jgi:tol-pal system protein YbgF